MDNKKVKLVDLTLHVEPIDKAELQRIAGLEGLSVSKVGATEEIAARVGCLGRKILRTTRAGKIEDHIFKIKK